MRIKKSLALFLAIGMGSHPSVSLANKEESTYERASRFVTEHPVLVAMAAVAAAVIARATLTTNPERPGANPFRRDFGAPGHRSDSDAYPGQEGGFSAEPIYLSAQAAAGAAALARWNRPESVLAREQWHREQAVIAQKQQMDSLRAEIAKRGYIASENIAALLSCEDLLPELQKLCEEKGRLGPFGSEFHSDAHLQSWQMRMEITPTACTVIFSLLEYETVLGGLPTAVLQLTKAVGTLLPFGRYEIQFLLISDKHTASKMTNPRVTSWHQDKFPLASRFLFSHLFFMEVLRTEFGDSTQKIGKIAKRSLESHGNDADRVPDGIPVTVLREVTGGAGAGYFIHQNFEDNGEVIVHRSPTLTKLTPEGRRYKVVMRILRV